MNAIAALANDATQLLIESYLTETITDGGHLLLIVDRDHERTTTKAMRGAIRETGIDRSLVEHSRRVGHPQSALRCPHYTASTGALVREAELAQGGLLWLDEADEWRSDTLRRFARGLDRSDALPVVLVVYDDPKRTGSVRAIWEARVARLAKAFKAKTVDLTAESLTDAFLSL